MKILQSLFLFVLGLCVGSFLNVVVYRFNHGLSPLLGRSICPKCKKKIPWQDNIPLLSFILLGGKCRFCKKSISPQYPLVELATGILFAVNYQGLSWIIMDYQGWLNLVYYLFLTSVLIAIFVSDLRYQTIPDKIVYPAIGLAFIWSVVSGWWLVVGVGAAAAGFFLLLVLLTRGKGMGLGDVKLAGLMGLVLGWPKIVIALYLSFLTGAVVGVILVLSRKKRFGEHIPFGPFLAGATWISIFWGEAFWQLYLMILGLR